MSHIKIQKFLQDFDGLIFAEHQKTLEEYLALIIKLGIIMKNLYHLNMDYTSKIVHGRMIKQTLVLILVAVESINNL